MCVECLDIRHEKYGAAGLCKGSSGCYYSGLGFALALGMLVYFLLYVAVARCSIKVASFRLTGYIHEVRSGKCYF